jgi:hypothetical protein
MWRNSSCEEVERKKWLNAKGVKFEEVTEVWRYELCKGMVVCRVKRRDLKYRISAQSKEYPHDTCHKK